MGAVSANSELHRREGEATPPPGRRRVSDRKAAGLLTAPGALALAVGLLLCPNAEAASPTDTVREMFAKANQLLVERPAAGLGAERTAAVLTLLRGVFDVRDAARRALGPDWRGLTRREQDEFTALFGQVLERSYVHLMASAADVDATAGIRIRYTGESLGREATTVRALVIGKDRDELRLDHEMVRRGQRWMVREVRLGDVDLVANYRAQFQRTLRDASYAELLARMRARLVEPSRARQEHGQPTQTRTDTARAWSAAEAP
jgi:phospholipid transport system substrate-binding protein